MRRRFAWVQNRSGTPVKLFERGSPSPVAAAKRYAIVQERKTGKKLYPKWNWR